ncbi:AI-2E family transporter [Arenibacter algicola]|uniref:AI-2E family transporter n=1 Tax=Arenibacter algicola TaxID=616991 RepID=UPI001C0708BE|nr:AI-2E family transporter [Arenibacter algicola]MBU2905918.1 AI-2E family transporter [Arenibacter algicola]
MIKHKVIRQIFTLFLILLMGGLIFKEMAPYLSGVLGAITMYVVLIKPLNILVSKGWNKYIATIMLMVISFIAILLPVAGAIIMLGNKIGSAVKNLEKVVTAFKTQLGNLENRLGYDLTSQIDASAVSGWVSENLQGIAGGTFDTVIAISIMYFFLFYMLTNRKKLLQSLFEYIPINDNHLNLIGSETREMVRANAIGIPLVAIAQGIVALLGFIIFDIENPFFWSVIVTIGSMIPFIGNFLGTIPVFILSLSSGDTFQAWGILLYGIVVVGITDNVIRLYVLQKLDDVHPLITLTGVIVGIPLFGFIGLIFGPLLISLFLLIVKIYNAEYGRNKKIII